MAGRTTSPTITAGVVGIIKQVWYLVLTVFAVHRRAFHIFSVVL